MPRLAVMATYSASGTLAPHVGLQVESLCAAFERVIVVATSQLSTEARAWITARAELIERPNEGYDFESYRVGLEAAGDLGDYDLVAICNDSYVPLRPYSEIVAWSQHEPADVWGITHSVEIAPHLQSYFVLFGRTALASDAFRDFWTDMAITSRRRQVIRRYEVGLSTALTAGGLRLAAYFVPSRRDLAVARRRLLWNRLRRDGFPTRRTELRAMRSKVAGGQFNPGIALADAALDRARLPVMKIDTLRYDPYRLGADRLLTLGEAAFPDRIAGVRAFLAETDAVYAARENPPVPWWLRPFTPWVRYRTR